MTICLCKHFDTNHAEDGRGYCFAGTCRCEIFREDVVASNAARKAVEDETSRESNGYEEPKGESA